MGSRSSKPGVVAGIDVSAKELVVALIRGRGEKVNLTVPNTGEGHDTLLRALRLKGGAIRVVVEATGTYHLDLALTLAAAKGVEVMVANPLAARRFAQATMRRAKTDKVDSEVLLEFCQRMAFVPWVPPSLVTLEFRAVTRYLGSLITDQTAIKNRIRAAKGTTSTPEYVLNDLQSQLEALEARVAACQAQAEVVAASDAELSAKLASLVSIPGIAERSGVQLLGELVVLDPTMGPDEVVAHAGLDPRPKQTGARDPARQISKVGNARIRAVLYMPAMSASRTNTVVNAWYSTLTERGKVPFVAHVAVMRRLLRIAWVLLVRKGAWDDAKFAPRQRPDEAVPPPVATGKKVKNVAVAS